MLDYQRVGVGTDRTRMDGGAIVPPAMVRTMSLGRIEGARTVPEEGGLSRDETFDLLRNRRRRDVVRYLASAGRTVTLSELAEHIAARENDVSIEELDYSQRKRVYVALYQTHLPKLDRANVLDYESGRGKVALSERAAELRPYLDDGADDELSGSFDRFSLWLGATGAGAVLIAHVVALLSLSLRLSLFSSLLAVLLFVSIVSVVSERDF